MINNKITAAKNTLLGRKPIESKNDSMALAGGSGLAGSGAETSSGAESEVAIAGAPPVRSSGFLITLTACFYWSGRILSI